MNRNFIYTLEIECNCFDRQLFTARTLCPKHGWVLRKRNMESQTNSPHFDKVESTAVKTKCCDCQKEIDSYITLLHVDGLLYSYCPECAAKKLDIVY